jgi:hypothetical protein
VGLIYDHELRAGSQEVVATAVCLDKVGGNYRKRVDIEDRLVAPQIPLQPSGSARKD